MDSLSRILEALKFKAVVYNKSVFTAPWGLNIAGTANSHFWRVLKGKCYIKLPNKEILEIQEGDLAFMPHGIPHWIASNPDSKRIDASEYVKARINGTPMFVGNDDETILIGGHFELDSKPTHPFIKSLPNIIYLTKLNSEEVNSWLKMTANILFDEASHNQPGSNLILSRMAEVTFVHLIRGYIEQTKSKTGFLLALKDQRISKALGLMQEFPEREWNLNLLSSEAGMSRSLFCKKFKEFVGETPLSYLTNWRITKAKEILSNSNEKISEVGLNVGYQSESAFNRIFKAKTSQTPANYRRSLISSQA